MRTDGGSVRPTIVGNCSQQYPSYPVVDDALAHPWMESTGFEPGDAPNDLVGYELDHVVAGCDVPGELTTLFDYVPQGDHLDGGQGAQAVTYTAPSGAEVFSTGSMNFAWALSDVSPPNRAESTANSAVEAFTRTMLDDMTTS